MPTAKELIDQVNALEGDEAVAVEKLLQNDQGAVVMKARGKIASAAKRDGAKDLPKIEQRAADAEAKVEELTAELEEARKAAPNLAEKEKEWKGKLDTEKEKAKQLATQKDETILDLRRRGLLSKFRNELTEKHRIDPEYAEEVLESRYKDRFRFADDGTPSVWKPKEDTAYDAANPDEQIVLLAADVAKDVSANKPRFVLAGSDQGGGRSNGAGGGSGKVTVDQLVEGKRKEPRYGNIL